METTFQRPSEDLEDRHTFRHNFSKSHVRQVLGLILRGFGKLYRDFSVWIGGKLLQRRCVLTLCTSSELVPPGILFLKPFSVFLRLGAMLGSMLEVV